MLYFYSYFYSFMDYSPFTLKAEFIAFLSTQSLLVLFSGSCSLPGGSERLLNKANSNRIRVNLSWNTPYPPLSFLRESSCTGQGTPWNTPFLNFCDFIINRDPGMGCSQSLLQIISAVVTHFDGPNLFNKAKICKQLNFKGKNNHKPAVNVIKMKVFQGLEITSFLSDKVLGQF